MPITQKIKPHEPHKYQIAIWEIKETLAELLQEAKNLDVSKFNTEKRKKEFLSIRILLNILDPNSIVSYNKYGAPQLENNKFISISHSENLAAVIISTNNVGLDIQKISKKPLELSSKFIAKNKHTPLTKEKATLIWSCKEAVFKWHQKGNINFIKDIQVDPFIIQKKGQLTAQFKQQRLRLHYQKINKHFLVYVCN